MISAVTHHALGILDIESAHHPNRLHLVNARIGGIEHSIMLAEPHLALHQFREVSSDLLARNPQPRRRPIWNHRQRDAAA